MPDSFFAEIITCNKNMLKLFEWIKNLSNSRQPVLITGETGVGKELFAKAIHRSSQVKGPFVPVNVAGLDDNNFSDTLFGHVKGAFTGADKERKGQCKLSVNGTLFLDEIGDLKPTSQVKLLRLLQEGEYQPLGGDQIELTNARILTATNVDLWELQKEGTFRKDLNYRLRTHHIHVPPLRERLDDICLLVNHFLDQAALEFKKRPYATEEIFTILKSYAFPGNIRELKAMIYNAVGICKSGRLPVDIFKSHIEQEQEVNLCPVTRGVDETSPFPFAVELPTIKQATELLVIEAMNRAEGRQTVAAKMLGISQPALSNRLKKMTQRTRGGIRCRI
ncbi:MAG: sigma 54-interacting transcriptional regulator [Desulfobacter sp.]